LANGTQKIQIYGLAFPLRLETSTRQSPTRASHQCQAINTKQVGSGLSFRFQGFNTGSSVVNHHRVEGKHMRNRLMGPPKPEWHIVTICPGFVVEVNCNGGGYRRVYRDGRIEAVDAAN
jgi:hypothetical protein